MGDLLDRFQVPSYRVDGRSLCGMHSAGSPGGANDKLPVLIPFADKERVKNLEERGARGENRVEPENHNCDVEPNIATVGGHIKEYKYRTGRTRSPSVSAYHSSRRR